MRMIKGTTITIKRRNAWLRRYIVGLETLASGSIMYNIISGAYRRKDDTEINSKTIKTFCFSPKAINALWI
jgi:hypothetical protein